jgi:hypothetical protein
MQNFFQNNWQWWSVEGGLFLVFSWASYRLTGTKKYKEQFKAIAMKWKFLF